MIVSAYQDDALGSDDATAIAQRIAGGEITAREAVEAAIRRCEEVNPILNAVVTPCFERALERADEAPDGAFAGVPTFIKDTDDAPGTPTRFGSLAVPPRVKERASPFVKQFLSTGLISLGKTTLPEFGLTATTESLLSGPTRNPWNPGYSTSGSSGGSAALVAAGVVPIAHGNDGGGSIRNPAACCGLVGLKPTRGRLVSMEGVERMPIAIVHQGVLTRTVRDTARFYASAERYWRNPNLPPIGLVDAPGARRLRMGIYTEAIKGSPCHPETADAVMKAGALCESLGHSVEPLPNHFDGRFASDFLVFWGLMAYSIACFGRCMIGRGFDSSKLDPWTRGCVKLFTRNALKTPMVIRRLKRLGAAFNEIFQTYDVLVSPTVGHPPPPLGYLAPDVPFNEALERIMKFSSFTPIHNISGTPAISLPMGMNSEGLPIGVMFAAGWGRERTLLELAFELEDAQPWPILKKPRRRA